MNKKRIYVKDGNGNLVPTNAEYSPDTHTIMIGFGPSSPSGDNGCTVEWEDDKILNIRILTARPTKC